MNKQLENSDCPLLSKEGQAEPFGSSLLELAKAARQRGLKTHSGQVQRGDVFVALPGVKVNGAKFMQQALQAGAFAIVGQKEEIAAFKSALAVSSSVKLCAVDQPREALALLAGSKYRTRQHKFPVIGITGTNGKTSITYLLEHLYQCAGKRAGVLGTVSYRWPGFEEQAPLTTPDCLSVHAMLARMQNEGKVDAAFLEVSSHALDQQRVLGVKFKAAVFTNLTQDHMDYHADMEDYFRAKSKLFFAPYAAPDQVAIINTDDAYGQRLAGMLAANDYGKNGLITYGLQKSSLDTQTCHLQGEIISCDRQGIKLGMSFHGNTWQIHSPLVGTYNALNLLAVQALAISQGFEPCDFKALDTFGGTPGRLEKIENSKGLSIFVDYAHTPDALINVQKVLKEVGFERLITVFGCGGNRDRGKRPLMGKAVADFADVAILTSDNPRLEDPLAIMDDVREGLRGCKHVIEEVDRKKAIAEGIRLMGPRDALLVAGKGHEDYQIIGDKKLPYSDQKVIQEILPCK